MPTLRLPHLRLLFDWVCALLTRAATNTIAKARVAYPVNAFPNFW